MIKRLKDEAGYSLVEVLVAIMILSIAIIPMVGMFDMGLKSATLGGNYDAARAIAGKELEEIRALPFRSPDPEPASNTANSVREIYPPGTTTSCTPPIETGYTCQVKTTFVRLDPASNAIVADSAARTMMEVEVTVTWNSGGNNYTTIGLVSQEAQL